MDDKLFELIEKMYSDLKNEISSVKKDLTNEIRTVGNQVLKLENDINPKIEALFDGYKQNTETLERIEKEVSKQEEIIMRRVK
jgi:gas vesicle protein